MNQNKEKYSKIIKDKAKLLGFLDCGISKVVFLEEEAPKLEKWLNNNYHGKMEYMTKNFDKRLNPELLVENAKSVISLTYNYFPKKKQVNNSYKISKYAYGKDYHYVIKKKLKNLMQFICENIGEVNGRAFVDSGPVMERSWAKKAGLGWIGKHSLLIHKGKGSFFFLAELIIDLPLAYDTPVQRDYCGTCTKCIESCPTQAILPNNTIDSNKCISYATIELKDSLPSYLKGKMNDWIFGCDICQDVCPWNRFSKPHREPLFEPHPDLLEMTKKEWEEITEDVFIKVFKKSALKRTKFTGLQKNISFLKD